MARRDRPRAGVDDVVLMPVSPSRQRRRLALATILAILAVLIAFGAGIWLGQGGALDQDRRNQTLRADLEEARDKLASARHDLARFRADAEVSDQAGEQLRQEIRGLRDQAAELEEAVAFYKNVMSPGTVDQPLQVQKFEVVPADGERRFRYRLILIQAGDNRGYLSGNVSLRLKGTRDGEAVTLETDDLLDENSDLRFRFRYFQELSGTLTVPEALQVSALEMTARATGGRRAEVTQSLPW
ncbi:hypothetical protein Y5W_01092 [Alcanivorax sp. 521-1]|uniref:Uncharacterized protein n=1 Tax=Alloalcanivorax profundimaris TaxID=2735259 RepID=A0ABS0ANT1_9GAMM|nr:DUF6776 family protein [Alloalcanivorax profundimaris]MBF5055798.1 hypothetical protein [Alloalcanivorax profundimaris]